MPFIHVRSLQFEKPIDIHSVVEGITEDFAKDVGIALEQVTATWEYMLPGSYAVAGRAASFQPRSSHPVLVDLLAPDFNNANTIEQMLKRYPSATPYAGLFLTFGVPSNFPKTRSNYPLLLQS